VSEQKRNPPFATVQLRTDAAKRFKRVVNATAFLWRLLMVAEQHFRRPDAPKQFAAVYDGRKFEDGKLVKEKGLRVAA
jgi:putative transposase